MVYEIKLVVETINVHCVYRHSILLLEKILMNVDLSEFDKHERKYIAVACVQISYSLFDNSKKTKDKLFYEYDDYNIYFIDILQKILPRINFDIYVKI
jgi:hypothetical protein